MTINDAAAAWRSIATTHAGLSPLVARHPGLVEAGEAVAHKWHLTPEPFSDATLSLMYASMLVRAAEFGDNPASRALAARFQRAYGGWIRVEGLPLRRAEPWASYVHSGLSQHLAGAGGDEVFASVRERLGRTSATERPYETYVLEYAGPAKTPGPGVAYLREAGWTLPDDATSTANYELVTKATGRTAHAWVIPRRDASSQLFLSAELLGLALAGDREALLKLWHEHGHSQSEAVVQELEVHFGTLREYEADRHAGVSFYWAVDRWWFDIYLLTGWHVGEVLDAHPPGSSSRRRLSGACRQPAGPAPPTGAHG